MEETRTLGPRAQNKKIANNEWRVPSTRLHVPRSTEGET